MPRNAKDEKLTELQKNVREGQVLLTKWALEKGANLNEITTKDLQVLKAADANPTWNRINTFFNSEASPYFRDNGSSRLIYDPIPNENYDLFLQSHEFAQGYTYQQYEEVRRSQGICHLETRNVPEGSYKEMKRLLRSHQITKAQEDNHMQKTIISFLFKGTNNILLPKASRADQTSDDESKKNCKPST